MISLTSVKQMYLHAFIYEMDDGEGKGFKDDFLIHFLVAGQIHGGVISPKWRLGRRGSGFSSKESRSHSEYIKSEMSATHPSGYLFASGWSSEEMSGED